jgi:hypothetical protein
MIEITILGDFNSHKMDSGIIESVHLKCEINLVSIQEGVQLGFSHCFLKAQNSASPSKLLMG